MKNGLKTKLTLALSTIALGATLIGAGTFAYFNDVDHVNNQFAAGILDLKVGSAEKNDPVNFDLSNLKPGDSVQRNFVLANNGTLAIQDVLMNVTATDFKDGQVGTSDQASFLAQFDVDVLNVVNPDLSTANPFQTATSILVPNQKLTLADLVNGPSAYSSKISPTYIKNNQINLAPTGLRANPGDKDGVQIKVTFRDDGVSQNAFQNDSIKVAFDLTATQMPGLTLNGGAPNGYLKGNETLTPAAPYADGTSTVTPFDETVIENPLEP